VPPSGTPIATPHGSFLHPNIRRLFINFEREAGSTITAEAAAAHSRIAELTRLNEESCENMVHLLAENQRLSQSSRGHFSQYLANLRTENQRLQNLQRDLSKRPANRKNQLKNTLLVAVFAMIVVVYLLRELNTHDTLVIDLRVENQCLTQQLTNAIAGTQRFSQQLADADAENQRLSQQLADLVTENQGLLDFQRNLQRQLADKEYMLQLAFFGMALAVIWALCLLCYVIISRSNL
jgi:hypothetical protein